MSDLVFIKSIDKKDPKKPVWGGVPRVSITRPAIANEVDPVQPEATVEDQKITRQSLTIGTIVIMGLHGTVITITNLIFSKLLNVSGITYPWYVAVLISIAIVTIFYPVMILFKKKYPIMLGKNSLNF